MDLNLTTTLTTISKEIIDAQIAAKALAIQLNADRHECTWGITNDSDGLEWQVRISYSFGNYHCSSYVSEKQSIAQAVDHIRMAREERLSQQERYEREREEYEIKEMLFKEYLEKANK